MLMTSDPFLAFAETVAPAHKPRRQAVRKKQEAALAERDHLFHIYKKQRKEDVDKLLAGPYGAEAKQLFEFLEHVNLHIGHELVEYVRSGPWRHADDDTRFMILASIDAALMRLRERDGLEPFSDPLPDEASSPFLIIRELLR
jgi:hypothetical protein